MAEEKKSELKEEIEVSDKVKRIIDSIGSLNVMELVQLVKALEKTFGISGVPIVAAGVGAPTAAQSTGAQAAEAKEEAKKKVFNVILKEAGPNKLQVIKEVRAILPNLNIKEAKDFVESLPKTLKEGVEEKEANELKDRFEKIGAKVELAAA